MMPTMIEPRTKVTFYVSERIRRALNIAAAERNQSVGDIIEELTERNLSDQVSRAEQAINQNEQTPASKRGRKPKSD